MDLADVSVTWVMSATATVLLMTYFWFSRPNPKYPPCPSRPWPIVGNLLQLRPDPREQLLRFRKQCGDIYSLYLGATHVVVVNGFDLMKEVFVKQGDNFNDRGVIFIDRITDGINKGIASANGPNWKENRTFSVSVLKNFGLGKNILAEKIQEEVNHYLKVLEDFNGKPKNIHNFTTISVSNIMCSMIVGQRYEYDNKEFQKIQDIIGFNLSKIKGTAILNYFPWLRFMPGDLFYCKILAKNFSTFYDIFARAHIKENENVVGEPGNFIAAYLQEIKRKEKAGEKTYLDEPNLTRAILDLFVAGMDTTSSTLGWIFLYMINYPDVQEKIFQEIRDVVGLDRSPGIQDKAQLIYLTATIMEIQRVVSLLPLSLPRVASADTYLRGYLIPQGSEILVNYQSVLNDTAVWGEDAEKFRPERFISADGSLMSLEAWIPFSIGKRNCMGESMGKMELFVYVSNVLQRFKLLPADPKKIPPLKGHFGIVNSPLPYDIRFVSRSTS